MSLRDNPLTTTSTCSRQQAAAQTTQLGGIPYTNSQSLRKRFATTPWSAPISKTNTVNYPNLPDNSQDNKDSSNSNVPIKRRRILRSFKDDDISNKKSENDRESINNNRIYVTYNNSNKDESKKRLPMKELTEEEHERL